MLVRAQGFPKVTSQTSSLKPVSAHSISVVVKAQALWMVQATRTADPSRFGLVKMRTFM